MADGRLLCVFYHALIRASEAAQSTGPQARARRRGQPPRLSPAEDRPGYAFNGPNWDFSESPLQGSYARRLAYDDVRSLEDVQPWLDR
jgi:hypothetical protein